MQALVPALPSSRLILAGLVGLAVLAGEPATAQGIQAAASAPAKAASGAARPQGRPSTARAVPTATQPEWGELSLGQQQALSPLAAGWPTLSEAQKRKWLAMSGNFQKLTPEERAKLHSRMADWVALSPQQRTQARLNFGETKSLAADDKKAKWEAYQALPAEEKRRLADGAQTRTPTTAAAVKPVPPQKLATVPKASREVKPPRIASAPPAGQAPAAAPVPIPLHQN